MEEQLISRLNKEVPGEGANLYRHLCDLIGKCKSTGNALQSLEELSLELKFERFRPLPGADKKKHLEDDPIVEGERKARRKTLVSLVNSSDSAPTTVQTEDFLRVSSILSVAGLGFSQSESYQIHLRVLDISKKFKEGLVSCRFWGKIMGTESDYYVFEGVLEGSPTSGVDGSGVDGSGDSEPRGVGANKSTYWVTNDGPLGKLTQLSNVSVEDIKSARLITKYLSGDLYRGVEACPFFHGKEIDLLRAQIARINAANKLHVAGYYTLDEETQSLAPTEDFAFPAAADLATQASWVHCSDYLLNNGKTSYPTPTDEMSEEEQAVLAAEMEANPLIPLLTPIAADPDTDAESGESLAWSIKSVGEKSSYTFNDVTKQYGVTVVISNRWPGHYTVSQGNEVYNIYIGYATKVRSLLPVPVGPPADGADPLPIIPPIILPYAGATQLGLPMIQTEPVLPDELPEPNPEEEEEASDGGEEDEGVDGE